jgi:hypothetical protein
MIQWFTRLLMLIGLIRHSTADDMINASMDDKLRDYEQAVQAVTTSTEKTLATNQRLRASISVARNRTERNIRQVEIRQLHH